MSETRREQTPSVSADGDDCRQGVAPGAGASQREARSRAIRQEVVHLCAKRLGARAAGSAGLERLARFVAAACKRRLQDRERGVAEGGGVAAPALMQRRKVMDQFRPVEPLAGGGRGAGGAGAAFDRGGVGDGHHGYIPLPPRACKAPRRLDFRRPGPFGLDRVPDRDGQIRSAEALDRPDAGRRRDVDFRQIAVDDVDADEDEAAALELGSDAFADRPLARRELGLLRRPAANHVGADVVADRDAVDGALRFAVDQDDPLVARATPRAGTSG